MDKKDEPRAPRNSKLSKDREDILLKFKDLIDQANNCVTYQESDNDHLPGDMYFRLRVQELKNMHPNSLSTKGVLEAARDDYLQGFIADHRLLISAEVFADLLVQAEVLLDHDYKDAAAVIIRSVLEDGIRRLCESHHIETGKRDTIQQLNEKLYIANAYTALVHKEIIAKAELGNSAAHGRFGEYSKNDVLAFLEFVVRFLGQYLR